MTHGEAVVHEHLPDHTRPPTKKERRRLHKEVDPVLLPEPEFQALHQQLQTKIPLAIELLDAALRHKVPFSVVLFARWYLAEDVVAVLHRRTKDWISLLKKNRNLETNRFVLKDAAGNRIALAGPHRSVEDLVPLIPATA